jgi:hypothetical protein
VFAQAPPQPVQALNLGEVSPIEDRKIAVPLHFAEVVPGSVGSLFTRLTMTAGEWKFDKFEVPKGLKLGASAKEIKQERNSRTGETVMQLHISAGSLAIPRGIVARLRFSQL